MKKNIKPKIYKYTVTLLKGEYLERKFCFAATSLDEAQRMTSEDFIKCLRRGNWVTSYEKISDGIYKFFVIDRMTHRDLTFDYLAIYMKEDI